MTRLGTATAAEAKAFNDEVALRRNGTAAAGGRSRQGARPSRALRSNRKTSIARRNGQRTAPRNWTLAPRQLDTDLARENGFITEAKETLVQLEADLEAQSEAEANDTAQEETARERVEDADEKRAAAETRFAEITHRAAEARAKLRSLESALSERKDLVAKITRQLDGLDAQIQDIEGKAPDAEKLTGVAETRPAAGCRKSATSKPKPLRPKRRPRRRRAKPAPGATKRHACVLRPMRFRPNAKPSPSCWRQSTTAISRLLSIRSACRLDMRPRSARRSATIWTRRLRPRPAFIGAISISRHEDQALPADAEPLVMHVEAPAELHRRLRQIGVIARSQGSRLQPHLKPGQRLVSREGDLVALGRVRCRRRWCDARGPASRAQEPLAGTRPQGGRSSGQAKDTIDAERAAAEAAQRAEAEERRLRQLWREKQSELAKTREQMTVLEKLARESRNAPRGGKRPNGRAPTKN